MKKATIFLSVFVTIFLSSCNSDVSPQLTLIADLSNEDVIDLVKINFLSQYGGIEAERKKVCETFYGYRDLCELDTIMAMDIIGMNPEFDINLNGQFKIDCSTTVFAPNRTRFRYFDKGSSGNLMLDDLSLEYDLQSNFSISRNSLNEDFVASAFTLRNLEFTLGNHTNLGGSISFNSNSCVFDYENCEFTELTTYRYRLSLVEKHSPRGERITYEGTIRKVNEIWTLETIEGLKFNLE